MPYLIEIEIKIHCLAESFRLILISRMKRKREDPLFGDRLQWKKKKQAVVIKFQDRTFETEYSQLFKVESIFTKRFSHKPDGKLFTSSFFPLIKQQFPKCSKVNYCEEFLN